MGGTDQWTRWDGSFWFNLKFFDQISNVFAGIRRRTISSKTGVSNRLNYCLLAMRKSWPWTRFRLPAKSTENGISLWNVSSQYLPRRSSLHFHPSLTRRRSSWLWIKFGAMVASAKCWKDFVIRCFNACRTQWRVTSKCRCIKNVERK